MRRLVAFVTAALFWALVIVAFLLLRDRVLVPLLVAGGYVPAPHP